MAYALEPVPIKVVGSSTFGIYPKINIEKTYNMFISDDWLVNYAGYRRVNNNIDGDEGRGLFHSARGNFDIVVVDDKVYRLNTALGATQVGSLNTRVGEVSIDENLSKQICIVDNNDAWIYNYGDNSFTQQTLNVGSFNVIPGYVCYHNSFFLIAPAENDPNNTNNWYAFQRATDTTISLVTGSIFPLQTKPDKCLAVKRLPGRANNVLVIGSIVCEVWTNVGGEENYRRNSSFNIDSGTVSKTTIAGNEQFLAFLSQNENNQPTIMVTDGSSVKSISTDGIDNLLQTINRPDISTAFFYRQDGHLFYQLTFYDPSDNLSLIYDFKTDMFFHVTDANYNFHPARETTYFAGRTIFVSLNRGSLYELSTDIDGAYENINATNGDTIPRVRVTNTVRLEDSKPFYVNNFTFLMEQGITNFPQLSEDNEVCFNFMITEATSQTMITEGGETMLAEDGYCVINLDRPRVDLSFSKLGNEAFSNIVGYLLNSEGHYRNRIRWHRLGFANEISFEIRFWGLNRFIANNGILRISR